MQTTQNPQLKIANTVLITEIKPKVTTEDRKAAMQELEVSVTTLVEYLKGRGRSLDTGIKMIEFFRKRIELREKVLVA